MTIQPLNDRVPIINPDGTPSQYFIRQLQERGITVDGKITAEQAAEIAQEIVDDWSAGRDVNVTAPITGGGPLSSDVTIGHQTSPVTPGSYTNTNLTVDAFGHITAASNGTGGGGSAAWSLVDQWSFAVDGAITSRVVDVSALNEIHVVCDDVTLSASNWRIIRVSTDGGSTYWNSAGNYVRYATSGAVDQNDAEIYFHSTSSSSARSGFISIGQLRLTGRKAFFTTSGNGGPNTFFKGSLDAITHIVITTVSGTANLNGGALYVYGR